MTGNRKHTGDELPREKQDVIVVGAGMAGLSAAALLAQQGLRVTLLEALHYPGGCASSFEKHGAVFDIGATTFSGVSPAQPLSTLFQRIGTFDELLSADPPMGVAIDGDLLIRHGDREKWIAEAEQFFGLPQRRFWERIGRYSDAAYRMLQHLPHLPPRTAGELLHSLPHLNGGVLRALPGAFRSVETHMRRLRVDTARFRRFIDAQLLITSQGAARDVPFLAGALGLAYPDYPVYSVRGGMKRYARWLEHRIRTFGGRVCYLQPVIAIREHHGEWSVETKRGTTLAADALVTNLPLFNLPAITEGAVRKYFARSVENIQRKKIMLWGAVTVYALIEDTLRKELPVNLQVILQHPLTHTGSSTLFLSFSHPEDTVRAPDGMRTLTISTHIPLERAPDRGDRTAYRAWKNAVLDEIMLALRREVPDLVSLKTVRQHVGTPATFFRYTGRAGGTVGGIPLHSSVFPFSYPRSATPFNGLYCTGDTFFPGQGIPGVTLGALAVTKRIIDGL